MPPKSQKLLEVYIACRRFVKKQTILKGIKLYEH